MSGVKYIKLTDTVIIHYGIKTVTLDSTHVKYDEVMKAIDENRLSDIPYIMDFEDRKTIKELLKIK